MYFFGLNHFIIYHEYNDLDFVAATSYSDPAVRMAFDVTGSSGNDVYSTNLAFTGNPYPLFSFKFGYLIDVSSDCPSSWGCVPHQQLPVRHRLPLSATTPTPPTCTAIGARVGVTSARVPPTTIALVATPPPSAESSTGPPAYANHYTTTTILFRTSVPAAPDTCLSCYAPGSSNCLSCNVTDNRYSDNASSCPCLPGYYDGGGSTCPVCHITCLTCAGGAPNNCLTCLPTAISFQYHFQPVQLHHWLCTHRLCCLQQMSLHLPKLPN